MRAQDYDGLDIRVGSLVFGFLTSDIVLPDYGKPQVVENIYDLVTRNGTVRKVRLSHNFVTEAHYCVSAEAVGITTQNKLVYQARGMFVFENDPTEWTTTRDITFQYGQAFVPDYMMHVAAHVRMRGSFLDCRQLSVERSPSALEDEQALPSISGFGEMRDYIGELVRKAEPPLPMYGRVLYYVGRDMVFVDSLHHGFVLPFDSLEKPRWMDAPTQETARRNLLSLSHTRQSIRATPSDKREWCLHLPCDRERYSERLDDDYSPTSPEYTPTISHPFSPTDPTYLPISYSPTTPTYSPTHPDLPVSALSLPPGRFHGYDPDPVEIQDHDSVRDFRHGQAHWLSGRIRIRVGDSMKILSDEDLDAEYAVAGFVGFNHVILLPDPDTRERIMRLDAVLFNPVSPNYEAENSDFEDGYQEYGMEHDEAETDGPRGHVGQTLSEIIHDSDLEGPEAETSGRKARKRKALHDLQDTIDALAGDSSMNEHAYTILSNKMKKLSEVVMG